jgi:hypothetical protein
MGIRFLEMDIILDFGTIGDRFLLGGFGVGV